MIDSNVKAIQDFLSRDNGVVAWQPLLEQILKAFECTSGTVHILDKKTNLLMIQAKVGIPDALLPKLSVIPIGKGMAGIAADRKQPVQICNLQTDDSGVARPSAKETKMEGSISVPMLIDDELFGVYGIAKPVPYDFTKEETDSLVDIGGLMSKRIMEAA